MDLDEDSHLCIRCNKTIIGLQNYVNHRQSNCGAQESSTKAFSPNFHFLDSHTNKNMQSYEAFTFDEHEEESEDEDEEEDEISERNNKSAESEFKEYDYDFFSSLELQYQSKRDDIPPASSKKCHQRILTRKATAALMATQNDDEWIDDSSAGINKKEREEEEGFKYFHNESNESTDSEEEPAVPRNYTRGKWKPGTRIMNSYGGEKWKNDIEDIVEFHENESSNDDNLDKSIDTHPPSISTLGSKVSSSSSYKRLEFKEEKYDSFLWCKICSRSLTSRANFERHLKSNLHKKRTKNENELEGAGESLPMSNINELSAHFEQSMKEKSVVTGENTEIIEIESEILNRATTSTPIIQRRRAHDDDDVDDYDEEDDNIYCALGAKGSEEKMEKKKFRSRSKITCEECDMKLSVHLFPNHLISHFHYRKMLQNPKNTFNSILNNFHKIVVHLPFQCQPCKFYFNTREQFTRHWNSIEHAETVSKLVGGKFLCSFCKFECESNGEMTAHLEHSEHQQVVTLINRSKPFVVRYISRISCKYCHQEFRFNIQLIRHLKTCDLKSQQKFPFDGYTNCNICEKVFQSALALQKHKRTIHKISIFYCSECKMTFETALDAKRHRKTSMHKAISQRQQNMRKGSLFEEFEKKQKKKICPHCKQEYLDVIELKQHIQIFHSEHKLR
jgi:Zinc-finger of C2H2 type